MSDPSLSDPGDAGVPGSITGSGTREQFMAIVRRKLLERGYSGEPLEAKLNEIVSKENISFTIDWDKVMGPLRGTL